MGVGTIDVKIKKMLEVGSEGDKEAIIAIQDYKYLGDRQTDIKYKGMRCIAVRRSDGKCIRGKNGSMLVQLGTKK
ncbi:MAG: hypothetical protein C4329_08060 [Chitinophagaceae bacterium]